MLRKSKDDNQIVRRHVVGNKKEMVGAEVTAKVAVGTYLA